MLEIKKPSLGGQKTALLGQECLQEKSIQNQSQHKLQLDFHLT